MLRRKCVGCWLVEDFISPLCRPHIVSARFLPHLDHRFLVRSPIENRHYLKRWTQRSQRAIMLKYSLERVLHSCPKRSFSLQRLSSLSKRDCYSRPHFASFTSQPRVLTERRAKLREQRSGINSVVPDFHLLSSLVSQIACFLSIFRPIQMWKRESNRKWRMKIKKKGS